MFVLTGHYWVNLNLCHKIGVTTKDDKSYVVLSVKDEKIKLPIHSHSTQGAFEYAEIMLQAWANGEKIFVPAGATLPSELPS